MSNQGNQKKVFQRAKNTIEAPKTPLRLCIAAIPAESIPFIGVAVLIADTGYELYAACGTVRDLDRLYSDLGMADESTEDVMHSVCDRELPDAGNIWDGVVEQSGECWGCLWRLCRVMASTVMCREAGDHHWQYQCPAC
jgi:hypothetical protein